MIPGILSNRNPVPKLYKCPWRRIISPTYIRVVIIADTIAEIPTVTNLRLPRRKEPTYIPTVTPKRMKNMAISVADKGDT